MTTIMLGNGAASPACPFTSYFKRPGRNRTSTRCRIWFWNQRVSVRAGTNRTTRVSGLLASCEGYREWGGCGFCRNPVAARSRWFARASRFLVFSIVAVDGMCHSSGVILAHKDSGPLPVPDVICVRSSRVFSSGRLCLTGGRLGVACPFGGVGRTVLCPR